MEREQLPLFGSHFAGTNREPTEGDLSAVPSELSPRYEVLALISKHKGRTHSELVTGCANGSDVTQARLDLLQGGLIENSMRARDNEAVWTLSDKGRRVWSSRKKNRSRKQAGAFDSD